MTTESFEVLVVGGGNAGLVAAITACERNKSVLLIEAAPEYDRGGNSKYTRDWRVAHKAGEFGIAEAYSAEEFLDDLVRVTRGETNLHLAKYVIERSNEVPKWAEKRGVKIGKPLSGALHLSRTNVFFIGGGKALINALYNYFLKLGKTRKCRVVYYTKVIDIYIEDKSFKSLIVERENGLRYTIHGNNLILASGGFQANIEILRKYWGDAVDNFVIRGSRWDTGIPLFKMIEYGAATVGKPDDGHMVAVDFRSPRFDGGIVTRVDSIPFGIVVNKYGERFYDEGEDLWPKRYAIWGKLIAKQPSQTAFSIFDSKVWGLFIPPFQPPISAGTIEELATKLVNFGLEKPDKLVETIQEFNKASIHNKNPDYTTLDGLSTRGISPPKSNWALPIDKPPFYAYPLRPGLTFTYMGLKVDEKARVIHINGNPFDNIFACGEIMSGNILSNGYLGGLGLVIGTVFGWTAGENI